MSIATAPSDLEASAAMQILLGWQRNARNALKWLHPSWLALVFGVVRTHSTDDTAVAEERLRSGLAVLLPRCDDACSLAAMRALLPVRPTLNTFSVSPAARLDALPIEAGLQVLRMQALLSRRVELRRLVDRTTRTRLAGWVGCKLDDLLRTAKPEASSLPNAKRVRVEMRPLASLNADELALEGIALLPRGEGLRNAKPSTARAVVCPMLRLALPRGEDRSCLDVTVPVTPFDDECEDTFALLSERIASLLPEYAWLSG